MHQKRLASAKEGNILCYFLARRKTALYVADILYLLYQCHQHPDGLHGAADTCLDIRICVSVLPTDPLCRENGKEIHHF